MKLKLKSTAEVSSDTFNVLVHGRPNTGKTISAATAEDPLIILTEPTGQHSLNRSNIVKIYGDNRPDICYELPYVEAYNYTEFMSVLEALEKDPQMAHVKTVFLDSLSNLAKIALAHFQVVSKDKRTVYSACKDGVNAAKNRLMALPKDTVHIAHSGEVGQNQFLMPALEGKKLAADTGHDFGELYFADVDFTDSGEKRYVFRTSKTESAEAKSRLGFLAESEPQNWRHIFGKLRSGLILANKAPEPIAAIPAGKPAAAAQATTTQPTNK